MREGDEEEREGRIEEIFVRLEKYITQNLQLAQVIFFFSFSFSLQYFPLPSLTNQNPKPKKTKVISPKSFKIISFF